MQANTLQRFNPYSAYFSKKNTMQISIIIPCSAKTYHTDYQYIVIIQIN